MPALTLRLTDHDHAGQRIAPQGTNATRAMEPGQTRDRPAGAILRATITPTRSLHMPRDTYTTITVPKSAGIIELVAECRELTPLDSFGRRPPRWGVLYAALVAYKNERLADALRADKAKAGPRRS